MGWEPRVGMRVVCVSGKKSTIEYIDILKRYYGVKFPCLNAEYTIRDVVTINYGGSPALALRLVEIDNRHFQRVPQHGGEPAFLASRFRPVEERKTDISIFTGLLTKAPTPEKEPA